MRWCESCDEGATWLFSRTKARGGVVVGMKEGGGGDGGTRTPTTHLLLSRSSDDESSASGPPGVRSDMVALKRSGSPTNIPHDMRARMPRCKFLGSFLEPDPWSGKSWLDILNKNR